MFTPSGYTDVRICPISVQKGSALSVLSTILSYWCLVQICSICVCAVLSFLHILCLCSMVLFCACNLCLVLSYLSYLFYSCVQHGSVPICWFCNLCSMRFYLAVFSTVLSHLLILCSTRFYLAVFITVLLQLTSNWIRIIYKLLISKLTINRKCFVRCIF